MKKLSIPSVPDTPVCNCPAHSSDKTLKANHTSPQKLKGDLTLPSIETFADIARNSSDAVFIIDTNLIISYANEAGLKTFGYERDTLIGQPLNILIPKKHRAKHYDYVCAFSAEAEASRSMETRNIITGVHASGAEIPLDITLTKHSDNPRYAYSAVCRDVSNRVQREKELKDALHKLGQTESQLRRAQLLSRTGNWSWNVTTGSFHSSDVIAEIIDSPLQDIRKAGDLIEGLHSTTTPMSETETFDPLTVDRYDICYFIYTPSGQRTVVRECGKKVNTPETSDIRFEGTLQDITPEWEREQKLASAMFDAQKSNRAKARFLAMVSHELRTPLNAIIGFSDIMRQQDPSAACLDQYRNYSGDIHSSGRHLLSLIDDLLTVSKQGLQGIQPSLAKALLSPIVDDIFSILENDAKAKGISLQCPEVQIDEIISDVKMIRQILINLLTNAVKFSSKGDTVIVRILKIDNAAKISVEDTGTGMSKDQCREIFKPFTQIEDIHSRNNDGIGLGLFIVKSLSSVLGGDIHVESTPGVGSIFTLSLPVAGPDNPDSASSNCTQTNQPNADVTSFI